MPSSATRQFGWACRIYRNASDKVLAIDTITVTQDTRRITMEQFHHSSVWQSSRMLMHLEVGSRVITKIQMIGDFDSITVDSGNYNTATWNGASSNENDSTMSFTELPQIGATV